MVHPSSSGAFLPVPPRPPADEPAPDSGAPVLSLPWRCDGILVYAQASERPSANDALLAMFTDAGVALRVVQDHNGALAGL